MRSQIVISNGRGGNRYSTYAFTEQGVAMLNSVLRSQTAIEVNIQIMRAFVSMRHFMVNNASVFSRLETMETDQQGYIVKKRVVICDSKKFKKITMEIFNQVKTLKIATTEKIDTIYFQYTIQGSPTLIHSKVDVKIIGYGYNNKSILMK